MMLEYDCRVSFARKLRRRTLGNEFDELVVQATRLRVAPHPLGDVFDAEFMIDGVRSARLTLLGWEIALSSRACSQTTHWHLRAWPQAGTGDDYDSLRQFGEIEKLVVRATDSLMSSFDRILVPGRVRHFYWHERSARRLCSLSTATRRLLEARR